MVKLYIEGGAQDSALDRSLCRQAFSKFFAAAGLEGKLPRTVPCGGRKAAYDLFVTAIQYAKGSLTFALLAKISPAKVEAASPHAKRLFECLRTL